MSSCPTMCSSVLASCGGIDLGSSCCVVDRGCSLVPCDCSYSPEVISKSAILSLTPFTGNGCKQIYTYITIGLLN